MIIRQFNIKNFGKIHDRTMTLSPGINVLYGENESGKSTTHTFIKSMLYGITRLRGRAAKNDMYTTYEPWENPAVYGGTLWFEAGGRKYRLTRNFSKLNPSGELFCEEDGTILDMEAGALEELLGDVSEAVYDNTVSVAQLKSVTGQDLVRELQNYMASYQGTGDSSIDLGRAMQMLKMSRKGFLVQEDRKKKEIQKEQEKISANLEYLHREMDEIREKIAQLDEKEQALHMKVGDTDGEALLDERISKVQSKKKKMAVFFAIAAAVPGIAGILAFSLFSDKIFIGMTLLALTLLAGLLGVIQQLRLGQELQRRMNMKDKWLSRQEKLKWNRESLNEAYTEKETDYRNLLAEYKECEESSYFPTMESMEIDALNLAMNTIEQLSGNIHSHVGGGLRKRTSQILCEITGGKYQEVLMDRDFGMSVNMQDRIVPLERLSRGTMEQIYFALRMAAGELFCGKESFPVILDDVFGMYDEDRLAAVLRWLYKEQKQIVISTCHKREMEILDKEGIPYEKLLL